MNRRALTITHKDLLSLQQNYKYLVLSISLNIVIYGVIIFIALTSLLSIAGGSPELVGTLLSGLLYFIPILISISSISYLNNSVFFAERSSGGYLLLATTPLRPVEIWFGKALTYFCMTILQTIPLIIIIVVALQFLPKEIATEDLSLYTNLALGSLSTIFITSAIASLFSYIFLITKNPKKSLAISSMAATFLYFGLIFFFNYNYKLINDNNFIAAISISIASIIITILFYLKTIKVPKHRVCGE